MKNKKLLLLLISLLLISPTVAPVTTAWAAGSASAETFHLHVPAAAELFTGTCPFGADWVPQTDTLCDDWYILYYREGQPFELREQPWILFVQHDALMAHSDGTFTLI